MEDNLHRLVPERRTVPLSSRTADGGRDGPEVEESEVPTMGPDPPGQVLGSRGAKSGSPPPSSDPEDDVPPDTLTLEDPRRRVGPRGSCRPVVTRPGLVDPVGSRSTDEAGGTRNQAREGRQVTRALSRAKDGRRDTRGLFRGPTSRRGSARAAAPTTIVLRLSEVPSRRRKTYVFRVVALLLLQELVT